MNKRNRVELTGRITRIQSEKVGHNKDLFKLTCGLVTDESYKDRNSGDWIQKEEWHNVTFLGKRAEAANKLFKHMDLITVFGKVTYNNYTPEGLTKSIKMMNIHFIDFEFLSRALSKNESTKSEESQDQVETAQHVADEPVTDEQ